jgi:hypothetical protein
VDDVEAPGAEPEVDGRGVDDHLVTGLAGADEAPVRPGRASLAVNLDVERLGRNHDPAPQLQQGVAASSTAARQTASIRSSSAASTLSSGVWFALVPLANSRAS